jgi:hypothetical protein
MLVSIRYHFNLNVVKIFLDFEMNERGYGRLVNLLSNHWDPKIEDIVSLGKCIHRDKYCEDVIQTVVEPNGGG